MLSLGDVRRRLSSSHTWVLHFSDICFCFSTVCSVVIGGYYTRFPSGVKPSYVNRRKWQEDVRRAAHL